MVQASLMVASPASGFLKSDYAAGEMFCLQLFETMLREGIRMTMKKVALLAVVMIPIFVGLTHAEEKAKPRKAVDLPEEKETTLGLYVTANEAYEKWTGQS